MRRLELGSGYQPWQPDDPEWEHADLSDVAPHVEHRINVHAFMPFPSDTFAELRAVDVLEHASYRDSAAVLGEWVRILAPGGRIFIQVPDAEQMMVRYLSNPQAMVQPEFADLPPVVSIAWRILGGHADGSYSRDGDDWRWNAHYALFSEDSLRWYLDAAGLRVESLHRNPFPNLQCWAVKPGYPSTPPPQGRG